MKKIKFLSVLALLMLISFAQSKSQQTDNYIYGEGTSSGAVSISVYGEDGFTGGEYDPYILGGLTVNYEVDATGGGVVIGDDVGNYYGYNYTTGSNTLTSTHDDEWTMAFGADYESTVSAVLSWS